MCVSSFFFFFFLQCTDVSTCNLFMTVYMYMYIVHVNVHVYTRLSAGLHDTEYRHCSHTDGYCGVSGGPPPSPWGQSSPEGPIQFQYGTGTTSLSQFHATAQLEEIRPHPPTTSYVCVHVRTCTLYVGICMYMLCANCGSNTKCVLYCKNALI